ncbi:hypothetical protein [Paenibacillus bovis]|uniref:Uncharacterized protein n=1 Tax=Paenibacillus bovis TaxID=1616788 RepID=A0A172ZCN4_9BACL|nr:hypothetical protein [Paenibacillus bovis]ANF94920.1 hypothetical protein AR543_01975 [Paenibacillus bovis]
MLSLLLLYYVLAAVYSVLRWKYRDRCGEDTAGAITLVVLLPLFGLFISLLRDGLRSGYLRLSRSTGHLTDEVADDQPVRVFRTLDVRKESNLVPLEEALLVNDHTSRRRLMLDFLKDDPGAMMPLLEQAVSNEDTETSHYAVTAVVEIKRKLTLSIQHYSVRYEQGDRSVAMLGEYAEAIRQYMHSGFMDRPTRRTYLSTYARLLGELIEAGGGDEQVFNAKIHSEMELERPDLALQYEQKFREAHTDSEQPYLTALQLYYDLQMKEAFFQTLQALKQSNIKVSNTGLNVIRYWSEKGA